MAALAVEFAEDVVQQEQGGFVAGGFDDFEFDDFESQDGGADFAARGRVLGRTIVEQHHEVFAVRAAGREAAQLVVCKAGF